MLVIAIVVIDAAKKKKKKKEKIKRNNTWLFNFRGHVFLKNTIQGERRGPFQQFALRKYLAGSDGHCILKCFDARNNIK